MNQRQFLSDAVLYNRMKPWFIDRFQVLDIVRDIECIPSVGPDGKILVQKIRIDKWKDYFNCKGC